MLTYVLIGIAVVIVLLVIVVATRPGSFRVHRSATMNAPPANVFAQVNDFHSWINWSPWEKLDPDLQRTHSGPQAGTGAFYGWTGNKKVGQGQMTITESRAPGMVRIKLEFLKPMKVTNTTEFTFEPVSANQTNVNWTMTGNCNFMFKAMGMFCSMDKMIGKDFEKGLSQMKSHVESESRTS